MQKYGLIGYPLRHSFSIGYFNEKFKSENIDAEYVNFEIPNINDFMEVIEENPNLCGLNVTIPYKEQVIPFLDELDKDTAKIGAVNVIKIIRQLYMHPFIELFCTKWLLSQFQNGVFEFLKSLGLNICFLHLYSTLLSLAIKNPSLLWIPGSICK